MNTLTVTDVRRLPGDSAFLLDDGNTTILYDSGFGFTGDAVAQKIADVIGSRSLDYIFLTHSHYDHALGSACVLDRWPDAVVVAGEHAASVFRRPGALAVMADLDSKMARRCGMTDFSFPGERLRVDVAVKDGDIIRAGDMSFVTVALPGHTKCSVGWYCPERKLLLGCETLGVFDGSRTIVPAFLVGCQLALDSIEKACALDVKQVVAPHMGLLSEQQTAYYLSHAEQASHDCIRFIADCLERDMPEEDIIDRFMELYVYGSDLDREVYPEDAARLNTSIMIKLIGKELLQR